MDAQPPGGAGSARLEPSGFHPKSSSPGPLREGWSPAWGWSLEGPLHAGGLHSPSGAPSPPRQGCTGPGGTRQWGESADARERPALGQGYFYRQLVAK